MDCSLPGFSVRYQLPELAQTHVHRVGDAIQPSHPLSSPSPALNLSQHQGLFTSGGLSIGAPASASVLPMNIQDWFPLGLTDLPAVQGTLKSLLQHHSSKASILGYSACFIVQLTSIHDYWKNHSFPSKEHLFNFMASVTICSDFGAQENKSVIVSIVSPSIYHEVMGPDAMIFIFWMLSFKPAFSLSSFTFIKRLFSSSSLSAIRVLCLHIWG